MHSVVDTSTRHCEGDRVGVGLIVCVGVGFFVGGGVLVGALVGFFVGFFVGDKVGGGGEVSGENWPREQKTRVQIPANQTLGMNLP